MPAASMPDGMQGGWSQHLIGSLETSEAGYCPSLELRVRVLVWMVYLSQAAIRSLDILR